MATNKRLDCDISTSEDGALIVNWTTPQQRRAEMRERQAAFSEALDGWRQWKKEDIQKASHSR